MDPRGPFDRTLWVLVPLWIVCFGLSLHSVITQVGYPTLILTRAQASGGAPELVGLAAGSGAEEAGLRVGDRIRAAGGESLLGRGHTALYPIFYEASRAEGEVPVVFERGGEVGRAVVPVRSYRIYWPRLPASFVFALAALLLTLQAPRSRLVRAFAQTFLVAACFLACTFGGSQSVTLFSFVVHVFSVGFAIPLALRAALLFPDGARPPNALGDFARYGPWLFLALIPFESSRFYEFPFGRSLGNLGMTLGDLLFFALLVGIASHTYRMADALSRRQIKWVLLGVYLAVALPAAATALAAFDVGVFSLLVVSMSTLALIPISVVIAIARYNLLDIDRLINSTASYTLIGLVGAGTLLALGPAVAERFSATLGIESANAQLALSLALAIAVIPAHRWLAPRVESVFYPARPALEKSLEGLAERLGASKGPAALAETVGAGLDELFHPESCSVYVRDGESFAPIWVRGHVVPPAFPASSPLVSVLEERGVPLSAEGLRRRGGESSLSPFDRAALETLGVPVILPVRPAGALAAVICLGSKRSGDIYTSSELDLLGRLAERVSAGFARFGPEQLTEEARSMQTALRRYVPGALVDELVHGRELVEGRREVTVSFVDIRGYSRFSEERSADEIFSTVNRYTKLVSEVVRANGGSVVEFNGDGMMAVFGAPRELESKERAAVLAGREIVRAVAALPVEGAESGASLEVGVGIATGEAFVGNIQAADRAIWSAVGNTTNLAARLQEMTRKLDAAIVTDAATWQAAGEAGEGFVAHEALAIRGRSGRQDLYALPPEAGRSKA